MWMYERRGDKVDLLARQLEIIGQRRNGRQQSNERGAQQCGPSVDHVTLLYAMGITRTRVSPHSLIQREPASKILKNHCASQNLRTVCASATKDNEDRPS
jgi:hypothetical protein